MSKEEYKTIKSKPRKYEGLTVVQMYVEEDAGKMHDRNGALREHHL